MEQLRIMLSEASSKNFTQSVKSLTALNGGTDGIELSPGLKSGVAALEKAGQNVVNPRLQDWYVALQKEKIGVAGIGEMMAGRATPAETIKKIQKFADEAPRTPRSSTTSTDEQCRGPSRRPGAGPGLTRGTSGAPSREDRGR